MAYYNYYAAVKADVEQYIADNLEYLHFDVDNIGDLQNEIYEACFVSDSVTGNASGSYTFNRTEAQEYVCGNHDLLIEALEDFCVPAEEIAKRFLESDFEYFDVTIRCHVLSHAIFEIFDEHEKDIQAYIDELKEEREAV